MSRAVVYFVIVLALSSLISPSTSQSLATSSVEIPFSGTIQDSILKKADIIYAKRTFTDAEIAFAAGNFDLLSCSFGVDTVALQKLKTANPNIRIIGYFDILALPYSTTNSWWSTTCPYTAADLNEINTHEDWFLHDLAGNRIIHPAHPWYLMNITSGWRQYYINYADNLCNSLYDGVFVDDAWNELSDFLRWGILVDAKTGATLTVSDVDSSFTANWHSNMTSMLQELKNTLPNKLVIPNTYADLDNPTNEKHTYATATDGRMFEGFGHKWNFAFDTFPVWYPIMNDINDMIRESTNGKICFTEASGHPVPADTALVDRLVKYCYVADLLAMNGSRMLLLIP